MAEKTGFEFPVDPSGQWDGFNDAGMEHFTGSPFAGLGREVSQNVLDATDREPARMEVRLVSVDSASIPNVDELKSTIEACKAAAPDESEKADIFFTRALELINQPKIPVLQIADFNTTGVTGPCENGTPYFALMKASGQSKHAGDNTLGTFGIGKYAPFVVSELRTIFVSPIWAEEFDRYHYLQAKSVLMSHNDSQGRTHRGTGYWGIKSKCMPVVGLHRNLPKWLMRANDVDEFEEAQGTTLSILGFDPVKGWQQKLGATVAENFFGAIVRGKLEVNIDNVLILNKQTIHEILDDETIKAALADMKDEPGKFEDAKSYLEAISGGSEVRREQTENFHLGNCELRLLVREGLPKKIAFLRDGMFITEDLDRLKRFGDFKEFVGVVECHSSKGNKLLKNMEPPKHDDFEPDRLPTRKEQHSGRVALRELAIWVREMLKRHAQDPVSEVTTVDELKDFFWDETDHAADSRESEENPLGNVIIRARPLRRKDRPATYERPEDGGGEGEMAGDGDGDLEGSGEGEYGGGGSGDGGDVGSGGPEEGTGEGTHGGGSDGGATKNTPARVRLLNVRSIPIGARKRMIAFTPDFSGDVRIAVEDSGADSNYALQVVASNAGTVTQGKIDGLNVTAEMRCSLEIELSQDFDGAMRVTADAV
jgi:hypothetical protein